MKLMRFIGILIATALLFSLVPVVLAAEDSVTGSFTPANVLPTVTAVDIYTIDTHAMVTNVSPQVYYSVNVTAGDGNTIDDIEEIQVQLFFDAGDADGLPPGAGDSQECGYLTWDRDGGAFEWTIEDNGGTWSWSIVSANCTKPSDFGTATGEWAFIMRADKVATETFPTGDNWDLYAESIDGSGSGNMTSPNEKEMLWYGEISTSATAPFGTVENDSGFADDTNEITDISVTYISNGDFDQKVKSDATWDGASHTAIYDSTGACDDQREFSLKAYDSDVFGSAVQVDTVGVSIDATGTQTDEDGTDVTTNTLWLRIALVFDNDTYSGSIYYIIADR
jgi:hypothetical protein